MRLVDRLKIKKNYNVLRLELSSDSKMHLIYLARISKLVFNPDSVLKAKDKRIEILTYGINGNVKDSIVNMLAKEITSKDFNDLYFYHSDYDKFYRKRYIYVYYKFNRVILLGNDTNIFLSLYLIKDYRDSFLNYEAIKVVNKRYLTKIKNWKERNL